MTGSYNTLIPRFTTARYPMHEILVLYYSATGGVRELAQLVARGISMEPEASPRIRSVPRVSTVCEATEPAVPDTGAPYATAQDLEECIGVAVGSPTRFGNMAAPMKYFWDATGALWARGALSGKPACVFTSTTTMHGGQESTLLSMLPPLLHHGMVIVGLPYTEPDLTKTTSGGSPYGASHWAGPGNDRPISDEERRLAIALGRRLAQVALRLNAS
jgi:NAD(P)H dehydrogenase (quinone)